MDNSAAVFSSSPKKTNVVGTSNEYSQHILIKTSEKLSQKLPDAPPFQLFWHSSPFFFLTMKHFIFICNLKSTSPNSRGQLKII